MDTAAAPWLGGTTDRFGIRTATQAYLALGGTMLVCAALHPPLPVFVLSIVGFFICGTGLQAGIAGTVSHRGSGVFARYVTSSDFGSATGPLAGWLVVDMLGDPAWSLGIGGACYLLALLPASRLSGPAAAR